MFDCVLLMAGSSQRMNTNVNKVRLLLKGKPVYEYSLDLFLKIEELNRIVLVVNSNDYDELKQLESDKIKVVLGGKERQDSVLNGLLECNQDVVLIHDAARPNITKKEVLEVYENAVKYDASVLCVPVKYAIKEGKDGFINKTIDRSSVYEMQTPQGVNRQLMIDGLKRNKQLVYDDIEILEKGFGIKAKMVIGRYDNIKITTKNDLDYLNYLYEARDE